jgi:hypothetical protein
MSRFIFVHDFYRDGYNDMLLEVQDLQAQGLWTKERRAKATKHEISTYHACKFKFPRMDMGYWAGRVAAIKSAATAQYPTQTVCRTPDGWDWDKHELIPLPMPRKLVQMEKTALELSTFVLPSATLLGFDLFNLMSPTSHLALIQELAIIVLVSWQSEDIARFLFSFLYKLIEGKDA